MTLLRSLLYAAIFDPTTVAWVLVGVPVSLLGRGPMLKVVLGWVEFHHWLVTHVLGIHIRVDGCVPPGPHLIAVKHQSMFETLEMVTRRYGVIAVERSAGAKALRALVEEGRRAIATGRPVVIYPEGTRVSVGEAPPLRSGFAALYRALGLPVVPVAVDSGRLWGRGFIHRSGTVTLKVGETVRPGLDRKSLEARVHAAINALELAPEARP